MKLNTPRRRSARRAIESLRATPVSLMPPGLLGGLDKDQLRDLFAYLSKEEKKD